MDFELTPEEKAFQKEIHEFLDKECPKKLVRAMMDDEKGYSPELWKKMADLGWQGLAFPEQFGGVGSSFLDLVVLLEEMGRALVPGPFLSTVVHGGRAILLAGNEQQKQDYLPKIANGDLMVTLALTEETGSIDAAGINVKAKADNERFIINGKKLFIPDANVADCFVVVARTKGSARKENGITLFLIDSKTDGIKVETLKTMSGEKLCAIDFNDVSVRWTRAGLSLNRYWKRQRWQNVPG